MKTTGILAFILGIMLSAFGNLQAQWITQTNVLIAGWNSVYLHLDTSHTDLRGLIKLTDPIEKVFIWNSDLPPGQGVAVPPSEPSGSQWMVWENLATQSQVTLPSNAAMLVQVKTGTKRFPWMVKGRPVPPVNRWTLSGLNFLGFQTTTPSPNFYTFFSADAQSIDWGISAQIFRYKGGKLRNSNPLEFQPTSRTTEVVARTEAFWIRLGTADAPLFNDYFGPFNLSGLGARGVEFGQLLGQKKIYLKNMSKREVQISLAQVASEASPTGFVPQPLPLMVRGDLEPTTLIFQYSELSVNSAPKVWTLKPKGELGSEVEVVLGLNRSQMSGDEGDLYAGVLQFTDSLGLLKVQIGISAEVPSRNGLWVGEASITEVSQYLPIYVQGTNATHFHFQLNRLGLAQGTNMLGTNVLWHASGLNDTLYRWDPESRRILVFGGPNAARGEYLKDPELGPVLTNPGSVARPFPLRLIVHQGESSAQLLQRVYLGTDTQGELTITTSEAALPENSLAHARRISAIHLPTGDLPSPFGQPWTLTGSLLQGSSLKTLIQLSPSDHSSNPFLHTYHPDHDNLDASFQTQLPVGQETYSVSREIELHFAEPETDFESLTRSGSIMVGDYLESITFTGRAGSMKSFQVGGYFHLTRIAETPTLIQQP